MNYEFDWTPPATAVGNITIYVAGNAANGNGNEQGDHIYTANVHPDSRGRRGRAPSIDAGRRGERRQFPARHRARFLARPSRGAIFLR